MIQFDGTLAELIDSELAAALLINRRDHFLIVLEGTAQRCVSCTNTSRHLKRLTLGRGGHFIYLLDPGAS